MTRVFPPRPTMQTTMYMRGISTPATPVPGRPPDPVPLTHLEVLKRHVSLRNVSLKRNPGKEILAQSSAMVEGSAEVYSIIAVVLSLARSLFQAVLSWWPLCYERVKQKREIVSFFSGHRDTKSHTLAGRMIPALLRTTKNTWSMS